MNKIVIYLCWCWDPTANDGLQEWWSLMMLTLIITNINDRWWSVDNDGWCFASHGWTGRVDKDEHRMSSAHRCWVDPHVSSIVHEGLVLWQSDPKTPPISCKKIWFIVTKQSLTLEIHQHLSGQISSWLSQFFFIESTIESTHATTHVPWLPPQCSTWTGLTSDLPLHQDFGGERLGELRRAHGKPKLMITQWSLIPYWYSYDPMINAILTISINH